MSGLDPELRARVPHVDAGWAGEFVLELRIRGASGAEIGAALLEVESHVAECGGEVGESFGDASAYAADLDLPDSQRWTRGEVIRVGLTSVLSLVGVYLIVGGALAFGDSVRIPIGGVGALLAGNLAIFLALVVWSEPLLRLLTGRPVISVPVIAAAFTALVAGSVLVDGPVLEVPATISILVGLLALAAAALAHQVARRTGRSLEDPIVFP